MMSILIISMATSPTVEAEKEVIDTEYMHSVKESWASTQSQYALRSIQTLGELSKNNEVNNFGQTIRNLTLNGTFMGENVQKASYKSYRDSSISTSGLKQELKVKDLNTTVNNLTISTESKITLELPHISKEFRADEKASVKNVPDTLLDNIGYQNEISSCGFSRMAYKLYRGDNYNGTARGTPLNQPSSISTVTSPDTKILLAEDIRNFDKDDTDNFAGYVSLSEPPFPSSFNENYVIDAPRLPEFENNQKALIHKGLWKSNFRRIINTGCYLTSNNNRPPSVKERIKEDEIGSTDSSIFTVIDTSQVGEDSTESNIGYERVNSNSLDLKKLHGISEGDGITFGYFRISEELAKNTSIENLIKN